MLVINENMNKLVEICQINLDNSVNVLEYLLKDRKFTKKQINKFKLGAFPKNINILKKYIDETFLLNYKIIDYRKNSKFSDTHEIIIPIFDEYNNAVAIMGRTLLSNEERELLSLSKYEASSYKKTNFLYGLNWARSFILKEKEAYVVEGNFDCISMSNNGVKNTVAVCGTAFTAKHFIKLARYTQTINFIMDRDEPGILAMRNINKKYANKRVRLRFFLLLKEFKDVDDYFKIEGHTKLSLINDLENFIPDID